MLKDPFSKVLWNSVLTLKNDSQLISCEKKLRDLKFLNSPFMPDFFKVSQKFEYHPTKIDLMANSTFRKTTLGQWDYPMKVFRACDTRGGKEGAFDLWLKTEAKGWKTLAFGRRLKRKIPNLRISFRLQIIWVSIYIEIWHDFSMQGYFFCNILNKEN